MFRVHFGWVPKALQRFDRYGKRDDKEQQGDKAGQDSNSTSSVCEIAVWGSTAAKSAAKPMAGCSSNSM